MLLFASSAGADRGAPPAAAPADELSDEPSPRSRSPLPEGAATPESPTSEALPAREPAAAASGRGEVTPTTTSLPHHGDEPQPHLQAAPPEYAYAASEETDQNPPPCACREPQRPRKGRRLELSFGSAQKFFGQSVSEPTGIVRNRTIPVTTVSVFGEWLFHPYFSVMALFDLPIEPRSTLVDGELRQEYVPPSLSGGIRATALQAYILEDTLIEGQFAALVGSTLADIGGDAIFPTLGWRMHLRDDEGLTLYAGTTFEFRLNRIALIYGVGHRF